MCQTSLDDSRHFCTNDTFDAVFLPKKIGISLCEITRNQGCKMKNNDAHIDPVCEGSAVTVLFCYMAVIGPLDAATLKCIANVGC